MEKSFFLMDTIAVALNYALFAFGENARKKLN
jgi:hypothetical protein